MVGEVFFFVVGGDDDGDKGWDLGVVFVDVKLFVVVEGDDEGDEGDDDYVDCDGEVVVGYGGEVLVIDDGDDDVEVGYGG